MTVRRNGVTPARIRTIELHAGLLAEIVGDFAESVESAGLEQEFTEEVLQILDEIKNAL